MPRNRGALEEQLRKAVKARLTKRGDPAAFAKAIGKTPSFVTQYLEETQHANLDASVAIARYFKFSLRMLTGLDPYPSHDEQIAKLLTLWEDAPEELRAAVLRVLEDPGARSHAIEAPQSVPRRGPERPLKGRKNRSTF